MGLDMEDQRGRVLVIDDEVKLARVIARALAPTHEVVALASALEALVVIDKGQRFDLVLCDLMLPKVSGVAFYERVGLVAPDLLERIVFTTGGAYTTETVAFLGRPDIVHIIKPFPSIAALRTMVLEHLRRVRRAGADQEEGLR